MASYDPGNSRQILASLMGDLNADSQNNRCPKCDGEARRTRHHFGIVSDTHEHYGIIYKCNCLPVFWVISPETGDGRYANRRRHRIEEVKA